MFCRKYTFLMLKAHSLQFECVDFAFALLF